jgi:hypothetical protein
MKYAEDQNDWVQEKGNEHKLLLVSANSAHSSKFFKKTALIRSIKLPFYNDCKLINIVEPTTMPPIKMRFLKTGEKMFKLDGTSAPLFEVINSKGLNIDSDENLVEYIKFYFDSVKGELGGFHIVENVDEINFSEDIPKDLYESLKEFIHGMEVVEYPENEEETKEVKLDMLYANCLYRTVVCVKDDGEIDVLSESPRYVDLPIREIRLR